MVSPAATVSELLALLTAGQLTAEQLTQSCLDRIQAHDGGIGAFLSVDADSALAQARAVDEARQSGRPLGPLAGLPLAVKDLLCSRGTATTCASRMLADYRPPYDAHAIELLRDAGVVVVGRTNMDEFAMGSSTENSAIQITRNPWDTARTPGGSSGGSAAAVAAGMVPLAIGTDTGGSIRQPASYCGVVGLKPTYGRVSRYGLVAFASSLDQIGPFARDVHGAAALLQAIAGPDSRDATSVDRAVPDYVTHLETPVDGLKIGIVPEQFQAALDDDVRQAMEQALDVYRSQGAEICEIDLPHSRYSVAAYYVIAPCEASSNLARYDGIHYGRRAAEYSDLTELYAASRGEGFGDEVKRRILIGTYALSAGYYDAYYLKALRVRRLIRQDFDRAFEHVDVLAGPVTPGPAFAIGEFTNDPLAMYLTDLFTIGANLAGLPGISVPAGFTASGLPIGLHLMSGPFEEERLLRTARLFERQTDWHHRTAFAET